MMPISNKNQVIPLPILGEIFLSVINDLISTNRARLVQISRAAHGRHFSPKRFGNLHRERTNTTRRTINQDLLPLLNLSFVAKTLQGGDCRHRYGRGFLERHIGRFQRQIFFTSTYILGKTARYGPEYLIIWLKLLYVSANRFNPPRHVSSEDLFFWFQKPKAN